MATVVDAEFFKVGLISLPRWAVSIYSMASIADIVIVTIAHNG